MYCILIDRRNDRFKTQVHRVNDIIRYKLKDITNITVIDHEQIKHSDLNRRGLHLSKSGTAKLAKNFIKHINHNYLWDPSEEMLQLTTVDTGSVSHVPVQVNMHHNIDAINNCHFTSENVPGDIDQSILCNESTNSVSRLREMKQKKPMQPFICFH